MLKERERLVIKDSSLKRRNLVIVGTFLLTAISTFCLADLSGSLSEQAIVKRLQPEGVVNIEADGQVAPKKTDVVLDIGQQRYEETCHVCHGPGLAGAPKFGDKAEWAPRIADGGIETLVKRAIQGYKAMPPKGTCTNCSDEEIHKAVEYMVSHSK